MDSGALREDLRSKAEITFSRSGGPGGQNVNKRDTKATLRLQVDALKTLNEADIQKLKTRLVHRISRNGYLVLQADGERSQGRNKEEVLERLETLVFHALRPDPKSRNKTKPSRAAKERRIMGKKKRSRVKKYRRKVSRNNED
jgi:ribosome-associated protein